MGDQGKGVGLGEPGAETSDYGHEASATGPRREPWMSVRKT